MNRSQGASGVLGISQAFRHHHNHRLDAAFDGRYFMRLPDGTRVPLDRYDERLAAYRAAQEKARQGSADDAQ